MKHCEFNFTMKAIHCIYWELKGQTKSVKGPGSKGISCLQYTVFGSLGFFAYHNIDLYTCAFKITNVKSLF